ncbi:Glycine-rich protein [Hirschfeldia incana]|nr:Glycine-rich protein [Hirschfeldia incana]
MMRFHLRFALFTVLYVLTANPKLIASWDETPIRYNNPPTPSPSPAPEPSTKPDDESSVSCVDDLHGVGSLDTTCKLVADLNLTRDHYISGKGNLDVLPGVRLVCNIPGCSLTVNISGNFSLAENSTVVAGSFRLAAENADFGIGSAVDTTGLGGEPPSGASGTPEGVEGAGGGYGGRGACCLSDTTGKLPGDVWGGDVYGWSSLEKPEVYGSRGGSTSNEVDYGGGGGGMVGMEILGRVGLNGSVLADGASGGVKGGGGSGGSIFVMAHKMEGNGRISASGGDGYAGGGGGRVSVHIYSRHSDPKIFIHGGSSFGCQENAGASGTLYDVVSESLTINNENKTTFTDTLLLEFPYHRLFTNLYIKNMAKVAVPLRWSRVQVQGSISLSNGGELNFGLTRYASSEFELFAEEVLMSNSAIKVFGALRMTVKVFLMLKSRMFIDGGGVTMLGTSMLDISNLLVLKESSVIQSNGNLGVHGQGLLHLRGAGDTIEAQRLILSLFYSIKVGAGAALRGPLQNTSTGGLTPKLYCQREDCPVELLHPPEDCNVNSSLPFTLQICRVEDITVEGLIKGSVIHFHLARTVVVRSSGTITADGMGCKGGVGTGRFLRSGIGSGGGHGGKGGSGCYNHTCIEGGDSYGNADLPCELGSGSGNEESEDSVAGGGIIVIGSLEHPLTSLSLEGSITTDGETPRKTLKTISNASLGPGGGSGGTVLFFLRSLDIAKSAILSSIGGNGSLKGGGGGSGGRIHFHWSDIPTGDVYHHIANVKGRVYVRGGLGASEDNLGEAGTLTGKACPEGLYGLYCEECPVGTYKNVTGSDKALCNLCPARDLPHRAVYVTVRGGVAEAPCPYQCVSDRYHMPHCYTTLEELIYTFGGPWLFGILLVVVLLLLALVFSVARMKFISGEEVHGAATTHHGSQIDHSFPFLESLNEVMETSRVEESQGHMHRIYFLGPNTFSEPWHLSHTPPDEIKEIVYEAAFNGFVDEINAIAAYQWWEGAIYIMLSVLVYPLAWSWQQSRRRLKFQKLRDFVRSEYDHSCLRSCRSRALYEGLKVAATPDLMLAHLDFFLGGDEKRNDLPPPVHERFPMPLVFGGDGSYMAYYSLQSDDILTSLLSQLVPPTTWFRFVAGLNAQLRLVQQGKLRSTFRSVMRWIETHGNPALKRNGVRVDLARFQTSPTSSCQYGILVQTIVDEVASNETEQQQHPWGVQIDNTSSDLHFTHSPSSSINHFRHRDGGEIIDIGSLQFLKEEKDVLSLISFLIHNTKPVGHQDLVGLVISVLLLGDLTLMLLTLLQLYSISMLDVFLALFILPLSIIFPFPAGVSALFSHGPRRSAGRTRVYALWNITSLVNAVVAFVCGYIHYHGSSAGKKIPSLQPWNISMDENEWWIFPGALFLCKVLQSQLVNWHVANLEIQDYSLYSDDSELFWQS